MSKQLARVLNAIAPLRPVASPLAATDEDYVDLAAMEAEDGDDEPVDLSDEDGDEEDHRPNSVVKGAYKAKYRARAREMARKPKGVAQKALERSCADWLAVELAKRTLTEGKKPSLIVHAFEAILDANGVKHAHWNRTTPGWQGRLRMTGRLALQRVVAEANELAIPGEAALVPPKAWVAKHAN